MADKNGVYFGACAAIVAASLGFIAPAFSPIRVLWYYPLQHRWAFETRSTAIAMDWFGRSLLACACGGLAGLAAYLIARRSKEISIRSFGLWAAWAATAAVFAMSVYTYQLAMRHPVPEPIPAWYVPR